jgi:hypothetical protein
MEALTLDDARERRVQQRQLLARNLAVHVGRTARFTNTGTIELEPDVVMRLAQACGAARTLTFGDYGSMSSRRFAAVMRACRDTTMLAVTITPAGLALRYTTPRSRGGITLTLRRVFDASAIVVPLHVVAVEPPRVEQRVTPPPPPAPRVEQPVPPRPRPAPPQPLAAHQRGHWLERVVDAFTQPFG